MNVLTAIQATYPNMTKIEKKVADFILGEEDGHYFLHVTLNQLASEIGVGQASVMRMINTCGYTSYRSFMAELSQTRYQESADRMGSRRKDSTLADNWNEVLQLCQSSLNQEELRLAAETLTHAEFVICTGFGNSAHIAALAASHLRRNGFLATLSVPGEIGFTVKDFPPNMRAVVLAFSISGETEEILRYGKEYADEGLCVIALTGRTESTLAKLANFTFFTPSQVADRKRGRWLDGMMSQLFVVEALVEEVKKIKYAKEKEN